jgi:NAD(P)-dependent dehydrogenase (short-subunit alcohol dehydrogenase family)
MSISDEQWNLTFRTNIYGCFYTVRVALPHPQSGSAIINVRSTPVSKGIADDLWGSTAYTNARRFATQHAICSGRAAGPLRSRLTQAPQRSVPAG